MPFHPAPLPSPTPAERTLATAARLARYTACNWDGERVVEAEIEAARAILAECVSKLLAAGLTETWPGYGSTSDEIVEAVGECLRDCAGQLARLPDELRDRARDRAEDAAAIEAAARADDRRHDTGWMEAA